MINWNKYTYLALDLITFLAPFTLSFDKKVAFYKSFKTLFPSILLASVPFLIWDIMFTQKGVWGFNPVYLSGIYFYNLPIEEVLFFFVVPYACLFIFSCAVGYKISFFKESHLPRYFIFLAIVLIITGAFNLTRLYTAVTFISFGLLILSTQKIITQKNEFLTSYILSLIPFFMVNGILTYLPVVWYNNAENLGIRIISIPIEDTMYGFSLIYLNKLFFDILNQKSQLRITQVS